MILRRTGFRSAIRRMDAGTLRLCLDDRLTGHYSKMGYARIAHNRLGT